MERSSKNGSQQPSRMVLIMFSLIFSRCFGLFWEIVATSQLFYPFEEHRTRRTQMSFFGGLWLGCLAVQNGLQQLYQMNVEDISSTISLLIPSSSANFKSIPILYTYTHHYKCIQNVIIYLYTYIHIYIYICIYIYTMRYHDTYCPGLVPSMSSFQKAIFIRKNAAHA